MMDQRFLPRIRGKVGTGSDGKFYFELSMWDIYGRELLFKPVTFGPFDSEKEANENMRELIKKTCDLMTGGSPEYLDMKTGELKPWELH